jgi:hypothetical protein
MHRLNRSGSGRIRQQRHIPSEFNRLFDLALTAGTIAAALARVYLAPMRQELGKGVDVLIVNVFSASPAETTLGLLPRSHKRSSSSRVSSSYPSHYVPVYNLKKTKARDSSGRVPA